MFAIRVLPSFLSFLPASEPAHEITVEPATIEQSWSLSAAALAASMPRLADGDQDEQYFQINAFHEHLRLGVVRQDLILPKFGTGTAVKLNEKNREDVPRYRTGVAISYGIEPISLELSFYEEKFWPFEQFDLLGGRVALQGVPRLGDFDWGSFLLEYGAAYAYDNGQGRVTFGDPSSGNRFDVNADIIYHNFDCHLGAGIDIAGFQLSAGAMWDVMSGAIHVGLANATEFDAGNLGGYARVAYRAAQIPLFVSGRYFVGDIEGFAVELGLRF